MGLRFDGKVQTQDVIIEYTDFNLARLKHNWKWTEGYIFMFVWAVISHQSKLQSILALSICKTKYVAIYEERKK